MIGTDWVGTTGGGAPEGARPSSGTQPEGTCAEVAMGSERDTCSAGFHKGTVTGTGARTDLTAAVSTCIDQVDTGAEVEAGVRTGAVQSQLPTAAVPTETGPAEQEGTGRVEDHTT